MKPANLFEGVCSKLTSSWPPAAAAAAEFREVIFMCAGALLESHLLGIGPPKLPLGAQGAPNGRTESDGPLGAQGAPKAPKRKPKVAPRRTKGARKTIK